MLAIRLGRACCACPSTYLTQAVPAGSSAEALRCQEIRFTLTASEQEILFALTASENGLPCVWIALPFWRNIEGALLHGRPSVPLHIPYVHMFHVGPSRGPVGIVRLALAVFMVNLGWAWVCGRTHWRTTYRTSGSNKLQY
eukprot:5289055-Alexandrium_andersonii.AAC.1